ncbi:hypothetical protein AAC387_Pa06g1392 [Persea americana]
MVSSQKRQPSESSLPSSSSSHQLGRNSISNAVLALPCQNPSAASANSPTTSKTVRGIINHGEDGLSCLRNGKVFKTSQASERNRDSHKKTEKSRKPVGITTSNPNLHSRHQLSSSSTVEPCEAHPTSHLRPINGFQNSNSSIAAMFGNYNFSVPIDGINQTEDNSVRATLSPEWKQSYNKMTIESRKPAMATTSLNLQSRRQSSLGIPMHPSEDHFSSHSFPIDDFGSSSSTTMAQFRPYDFSPLVDSIKQNGDSLMGASQALKLNQNSLNKEKNDESKRPPAMTTSGLSVRSSCQSSPGIIVHPFEAHPTGPSLPMNFFRNFSSSTGAHSGPYVSSAPVGGIKQTEIISMGATQALGGNQNSHKEKIEEYRKPLVPTTAGLNPHLRFYSAIGLPIHPHEAHSFRNVRVYDFSPPTAGIKRNEYGSMGAATLIRNPNSLNNEKTEESRKPPVMMTTSNLNPPSRHQLYPGITIHPNEVCPTSHSLIVNNSENFSLGTVALGPCDSSAPMDGMKQTGDMVVGASETMDLLSEQRSILHLPEKTSTALPPFEFDLNKPADFDLNF